MQKQFFQTLNVFKVISVQLRNVIHIKKTFCIINDLEQTSNNWWLIKTFKMVSKVVRWNLVETDERQRHFS
ncbi:GSCOCG00007892001-RA-CDS [Cotesia congregata]|nr:GSCOCG00007892001-RA-CDS [Cotesia congregata]